MCSLWEFPWIVFLLICDEREAGRKKYFVAAAVSTQKKQKPQHPDIKH
jgi:hypothetical protein